MIFFSGERDSASHPYPVAPTVGASYELVRQLLLVYDAYKRTTDT